MAENKINLVLISDNEATLEGQLAIVSNVGDLKIKVVCSRNVIDASSQFMLDKNSIVVINLTVNGSKELQDLNNLAGKKASVVIVGDQKNNELLSMAIRAGVKDFIDVNDYKGKLHEVICNIRNFLTSAYDNSHLGRLNVLINSKGGSGASVIASNMAYVLSKGTGLKVALVDLDLQFGSIGLNFDIIPKYTITEALNSIEDLDSSALEAYMSKYNENLSLLLSSPSEIILPGEIHIPHLKKLMELLKTNYNQTVVDLPRLIDPVASMVMEQADQITVVIQQSLVHFRDGRRLIQILNKDLDVPLEKISIVINRYDPKNSLRIEDLKNIINHDQVYTVTNDYERVASASNLGVPLCESSTDSKIALDIKELAKKLGKVVYEEPQKSWFRRLMSS
jgi:pilus assembly protein CpaE